MTQEQQSVRIKSILYYWLTSLRRHSDFKFKNVLCQRRIYHGCEVRIEKSVRGSLFGITRLCRVMPKVLPGEGTDFPIRTKQPWYILFLAYLLISSAWFYVKVATKESRSFTMTFAILKVDVICDVAMMTTPNVRVTWPPIQPMYWQHVLLFVFYLSHSWDKGM